MDKMFKSVSEDNDEEKEKYVVHMQPYMEYASDEAPLQDAMPLISTHPHMRHCTAIVWLLTIMFNG